MPCLFQIISVIALSIFSLLLAISLMNAAGHGVANHVRLVSLLTYSTCSSDVWNYGSVKCYLLSFHH